MKRTLLFLFLAGAIIGGCGSSTDGTSSNYLIPLSTGNRWIYTDSIIYVDSVLPPSISTDTMFVGLSTIIQGKHYYFFNGFNDGISIDVQPFRNTDNGVAVFTKDTESILFKYHTFSGEKYLVFRDSSAMPFDGPIIAEFVEVINTNEPVLTEKGTFRCYHYRIYFEITSERSESVIVQEGSQFFISPGIGIVKAIVPQPGFIGSTLIKVLKDFQIQ